MEKTSAKLLEQYHHLEREMDRLYLAIHKDFSIKYSEIDHSLREIRALTAVIGDIAYEATHATVQVDANKKGGRFDVIR